MRRGFHSFSDLPETLPVFPLTGVLLLPRAALPLNVFEPRYLELVDDALKGTRLIGMIQPVESEETVLRPKLSQVGCAAASSPGARPRITAISSPWPGSAASG